MRDTAIRNTHTHVVNIDGDTDAIDANGDVVVLDENLITAEVNRLKTVYDALAYSRNRVAEYPSIADQLDDIYHNGVDEWKKTIKAVKDKYPKE